MHGDESTFDRAQFQAKYGSAPRLSLHDENGAAPLHLFFYSSPGGLPTLPQDLRARLRTFVPRPPPTVVKSSDQTPTHFQRSYTEWTKKGRELRHEQVAVTVRESERAAQRELLTVLRLIDAGAVKVSAATRRPTSGAIKAISDVLEGGDYYPAAPRSDRDEEPGPIRAFAWPMLLQAGGLAELAGTSLRLSAAGRKALSAPPAETLRKLWSKWLGTTLLDELSRIEVIKGQGGKGGKTLTAVSGRREAIAAAPGRRGRALGGGNPAVPGGAQRRGAAGDGGAAPLEETQQRCAQVRDRGLARLVECATPELAALIAHDARTRRLCMQAGERHVVVPAASETEFRRGLRDLGYLLAEESIASATESPPRKPRGRRTQARRAAKDGDEAEA